jgi:hypothetical protein
MSRLGVLASRYSNQTGGVFVVDWSRITALPANTASGNDLIADANGAIGDQDGVTVAVDQLAMIAGESGGITNGLYWVVAVGGASAKWQLRRAHEFGTRQAVQGGCLVVVGKGTARKGWTYMVYADSTRVLGTSAITFDDVTAKVELAGGVITDAQHGTRGATAQHALASDAAAGFMPAGYGVTEAFDVGVAAAGGAVTVLTFQTGLTEDGMSRVVGVELEAWLLSTGLGGVASWGAVELTRAGGVVSLSSGATAERITLAAIGVVALAISGTNLIVTLDATADSRANARVLPIGSARARSLVAL